VFRLPVRQNDAGEKMVRGVGYPRSVLLAVCSALIVLCTGNSAPDESGAGMTSPRGTYGYVLRNFYYPVDADAQSCPQQSLGSLELFEQGLSPQDRAEYGGPQNREKRMKLMAERLGLKNVRLPAKMRTDDADSEALAKARMQLGVAPGKGAVVSLGSRFAYDTCSDPEDFPQFDRGNQTFLGPVSIGANLDGKVSKDNFTGPDGTRGIDNNLLRATGCNLGVKDSGDTKLAEKSLRSQTAPTAIELSGVDSFENDDDVTLKVYAAAQSLETGANGDALRYASIDLDGDQRYTAQVRARIVNGVLTTEPFAFAMRQKESVVEAYMGFVGTRLTIHFAPDGTIAGTAFGYQTLDSLDFIYHHLSQIAADYSGTSCPAITSALHRMADGFPDPRTHRFTAISAAYRFSGVPAFLIHSGGPGPSSGRTAR